MSAPDTRLPIFDPGMDVATLVFSHVRCVRTRVNLAVVSKLWREASKPAAAYPLEFDWGAFPYTCLRYRNQDWTRRIDRAIGLLDNDEAMSLPYERVVGLLGEVAKYVCDYAASRGSVRLLKWGRENNLDYWNTRTCGFAAARGHLPALKYLDENGCPWDSLTCYYAATHGHLPVLKYLHENGCPWDSYTCRYAAHHKHWDCLQYAVDNKCPKWRRYAQWYAKHLR